MLLSDFINKWNGKGIDFDGVYGDQCMDLMHQYCVEVLGLTDGRILAAPAAKDVYLNFVNISGNQYFDKIDNSPTGVPIPGDIIFWGTGIGQYGHVAIFESGDANNFSSFDQNWNGHSFCETVKHNYVGVLGWLRFKQTLPSNLQMELDTCRVDRDNHWNDLQACKNNLESVNQLVNDKNNEIAQAKAEASSLSSQVLSLESAKKSLEDIAKRVPQLEKERDQALQDRTLCLTGQESLNKRIAQLQNSSYLTAKTPVLISEITRRLFHLT